MKYNFLTFFWGKKYTEAHVNILFRALTEYCPFPFAFHVLTDRPLNVDPDIKQLELWSDYSSERKCWRRMRAFNYETMAFMPRYFALDLDMILFPQFPEIVKRTAENDFTLCLAENPAYPNSMYSGTMWQVGKLKVVDRLIYREFQKLMALPENNPIRRLGENLKRKGFDGSDSALLSYLFRDAPVQNIGLKDGVYSYPLHLIAKGWKEPPEDAKVVLFHGSQNDFLKSEIISKYKFICNYLDMFNG